MSKRFAVLIALLFYALVVVAQGPLSNQQKAIFRISGKVINAEDGQPLPNAEVYLARLPGPTGQESQLVDSEGRFSFSGLSAGKYALLAGKKGFLPQSFGGHEGYVIGIFVGPGLANPDLTLTLQPSGSITGVVRGDDGTPVQGAKISLFRDHLWEGLRRTFLVTDVSTDGRGVYRFSHLPAGKYYLAVSAENDFSSFVRLISSSVLVPRPWGPLPPELDAVYPVTFFPSATKAEAEQSLLLGAGERLHADFNLQSVSAMHIRIPAQATPEFKIRAFRDEDIDADMLLIPSDSQQWSTILVAPGKYSMALKFCKDDGSCVADHQQVELTADTTIDQRAIASRRTEIHGIALMDDGHPVASGTVLLLVPERSINPTKNVEIEVGEGGRIEWSGGILPQRYAVECQDTALFLKSMVVEGAKFLGSAIEMRGGGSIHISFEVTNKAGQVQGKVLQAGSPVPGAMVLLLPEDYQNNVPLVRRDESDSDGTFRLRPAPPGKYLAVALQNGWDLEWARPEVIKPYLVKAKSVSIAAGTTTEITLELQ
jgi:uncharacterized GH25 family protein